MSLEKKYFEQIYSKDSLIDGDYNAKSHAKYLFSLFGVVEAEVCSIVDFGFGKGNLLYECLKLFRPSKVAALDSSEYIYEKMKKKSWVKDWDVKLHHLEIQDFKYPQKAFDLGICNSVLQYVPDHLLETCVERMSYSCRYLYLHVPSFEDYSRLKDDVDFKDPWAIAREDKVYRDLLSHYFVKVGWGLMESKTNVEADGSAFFDSLYRD